MAKMKKSFYALTPSELQTAIRENRLNESASKLLFNWHYKKRKKEPCVIDLAKETKAFLTENYTFNLPQIEEEHQSVDKTVKFLFKLIIHIYKISI